MSNGVVEYHVEVDGSEVTLMLIAEDAEAANRIADTLTGLLKSGFLNELNGDETDE